MRKVFLLVLFFNIIISNSFGQFTTDEISYGSRIDLENSNSWGVGAGLTNFIMHWDLRSIGTGDQGNYINFGGMVYVNKMFNPLLGLEFKASLNKISGGAQYFSNTGNYFVVYANSVTNLNNLNFKGQAYGGELNLIFSFTNLYEASSSK